MTERPGNTYIPDSSDPSTDGLENDDPFLKRWHVMCENYSAARRALYAARAQLG